MVANNKKKEEKKKKKEIKEGKETRSVNQPEHRKKEFGVSRRFVNTGMKCTRIVVDVFVIDFITQ